MSPLSQEAYPPHLLAQKLNNRAAFCIETGRYGVAIENLIKALTISEKQQDSDSCKCEHCSLEACMTFSQEDTTQFSQQKTVTSEDAEGGYVYSQPIRVLPQCISEGHAMSLTLPLIITFNLALAHHLSALQAKEACRKKMQKVLKLYELAYRWQMEEDDAQLDSIRFTLVIANNLGEIHRAVNNHSKHKMCLQHLLSTIMFMVDCHNEKDKMELEGFFRNTSELILHGHGAAAA